MQGRIPQGHHAIHPDGNEGAVPLIGMTFEYGGAEGSSGPFAYVAVGEVDGQGHHLDVSVVFAGEEVFGGGYGPGREGYHDASLHGNGIRSVITATSLPLLGNRSTSATSPTSAAAADLEPLLIELSPQQAHHGDGSGHGGGGSARGVNPRRGGREVGTRGVGVGCGGGGEDECGYVGVANLVVGIHFIYRDINIQFLFGVVCFCSRDRGTRIGVAMKERYTLKNVMKFY
mmetsp:Transcript_25418/g.52484  ORF Transcript_25418/g.52484 Transcript_25418/m.52484 type:complete len:230 (-) Transcript_25418:157-846(-)